jgi:flagellar biosynthesis protein
MKKRPLPPPKKDITQAAALSYDPGQHVAPEVVAIGRGLRAQEIIKIAKEHQIPIYEDPSLVQALSQLEIGLEIPSDLYAVVAEVLAFVYALDQKYRT